MHGTIPWVFRIISMSNIIDKAKPSIIYCFTSSINPEYFGYLCYYSYKEHCSLKMLATG